jgi:predicted O-methyltransferase YrrM
MSLELQQKIAQWKLAGRRKPWFVEEAIDFLGNIVGKFTLVFEWGSGSSTRWFSERAQFVYSVEHQKEWFNAVLQNLEGLSNFELILLPLEPVELYVNVIQEVKGKHFDLIVIDGRERMRCFKRALDCLALGGYMVFDNINRPGYSEARKFLKNWESHEFVCTSKSGKEWVTGIYRRCC